MSTRQIIVAVTFACIMVLCGSATAHNAPPKTQSSPKAQPASCVITVEVWHKPGEAAPNLKLKKKPLLAGEPVWVKVTLKNQGREPVYVELLQPADDFELFVTAPDGRRAALTQAGKSLAEPRLDTGGSRARGEVAPGESLSKYFKVSYLFDMTVHGNYSVRATRQILSQTVKSKPLEIEL